MHGETDYSQLSDAELAAALWRAGDLSWLLKPSQVGIYNAVKQALWGDGGYLEPDGEHTLYVLELVRRFGKSFICGVIASELCVTKPNARVHWGAETGKQVTRILLPNMRIILELCPDDLRPTWIKSEDKWRWPNGSEIYMVGCEDEAKADRLRGDGTDLFIPDEAGHIEPLGYVIKSIALWMALRTKGRILIPSTPPKTPGHAFVHYAIRAQAEGAYQHRTIYESDLTERQIAEVIRECGGTDTPEFEREGLAMRVVDPEFAVLSEFAKNKQAIVGEWERPEYFDTYTSPDLGWHPDLTFVVFGYYDFKAAMLVVEDELVLAKMTTDVFAAEVVAKERALWSDYWQKLKNEQLPGDPDPREEVYRRVGDLDDRIIADLSKLHDLHFEKTAKHDKDSAINGLKIRIRQTRIRIHPRCKQLIAHCEAAIWNKRRTEFARVDGFGHFDGVDALVYLNRNIDESHNPYPAIPAWMAQNPDRYHIRPMAEANELQSLADLFTPKLGGH